MEKGGSKCSNPSSGGFEQLVTNLRKAARSRSSKSFVIGTSNMSALYIILTQNLETYTQFIDKMDLKLLSVLAFILQIYVFLFQRVPQPADHPVGVMESPVIVGVPPQILEVDRRVVP